MSMPLNRRLTRRDFVRLAGAALGTSILAGCGGATPPPTQAPAATQASGVAPAATQASGAAQAPGKAAGPLNLDFWHTENDPSRVAAFEKIIEKFHAKFPDIRIKQSTFPNSDLFSKVPAAVQSKTQPDFAHLSPQVMMVLPKGSYQPVGDIVEEIDKKYKFVPSALNGTKWDGERYMIPMYFLTHMLQYSEDMLKEAGFSKAPETWNDWLAVAKATTKGGKYGIALPTSKHLFSLQNVTDFMGTNGGDIFDKDGNVAFDTEQNRQTFAFYKEMAKYTPPDATGYTFAEANAAIISGQCAMVMLFGATWARFIKEAPDRADQFKAALIPVSNYPTAKHFAVGGPNMYMVFTPDKTKHQAIREFLLFLNEPEINGEWLSNFQPLLFLPVTEEAQKSKSFFEHPVVKRYSHVAKAMFENLAYTSDLGLNREAPNPKIGPIQGDLTLSQVMQKIVLDGWDVPKAVKWGHDRMVGLAK